MAYRKAILAEAQQEYCDIVGYLVGVLQSKQAARKGMLTFFQPRTSYAASPSDFLYCTGLIPPNDSFIRSSLYQRI